MEDGNPSSGGQLEKDIAEAVLLGGRVYVLLSHSSILEMLDVRSGAPRLGFTREADNRRARRVNE